MSSDEKWRLLWIAVRGAIIIGITLWLGHVAGCSTAHPCG